MMIPWMFNIEPLCMLTDRSKFIGKIARCSQKHSTVAWHMTWEAFGWKPDVLSELVSHTRQLNPSIKIVLLVDRWFQKDVERFLSLGIDEVLIIDFFALATASRIKEFGQQLNPFWNSSSDQFLFLTGKPAKKNRLRLLWKFNQADLLEHSLWSLFMPADDLASARILLPELSDIEFLKFIENHIKSPDLIEPKTIVSSIHYCGFPFDKTIYASSLFQVISETSFDGSAPPWITEKTWLPVLNHLPFIMAGDRNSLAHLKDVYDLRTFEKYLVHPDYDTIKNPELRLDAIVENAKYWLNAIISRKIEIQSDIEHNYAAFWKVIAQNQKNINEFLERHSLLATYEDIVLVLDKHDLQNNFYVWYENIRDQSWPDCESEEEWHHLPQHIKKECVEIFGYHPKKEST